MLYGDSINAQTVGDMSHQENNDNSAGCCIIIYGTL